MNSTSIRRNFSLSPLSRRFTSITIIFLIVLLGLMFYTTTIIQKQKSNAILIDMAGRQRMLFQKHLNEVYLTSQGIQADYKSTRKLLHSTLDSLMKGGSVILSPETGMKQTIPAATNEEILLKLQEQANYFDKVLESIDDFLLQAPDHPEFHGTLKSLRAQNSTLINIADDAVKQLGRHSELSIETMVKWETIIAIFVGLLGVYITGHGIREGRRMEDEIEERKRAEFALRDSELFLNSIVENIPDMIFVKDAKKLQFLRLNKAGEELVGHPKEAMIGKTDYHFFPKSEADFYTTKDREVLANKKPLDIPEERIQTKTQGIRYLHTQKIPILDEHGAPLYLLGISEDVTARKMSEERAKRLSRQNELILSSAGNGIYGLNLQGQTTFVNPAGAKMLGYSPQELIGCSMHTTIHHSKIDGSPYPQKECPMYAAFTDGTIRKVEDEVLWRKDGTSFPVEYTSTPIWEDGNLAGAVVTFQDVSERKQVEKKLRESEQKFRVMAETVPDILFTNQPDGSCDFANQRLYEYTGLPSGSGLGFEWTKALHSDDLERTKDKWLRTVHAGLPYEDRYRLISPNGTYRWFMARAIPVSNAEGEIEKWFGVSTDIHNLVQRDEALRQSEERLSYALEATREGVWDWDIKTDEVLFSKRWCENLGFAPEEVEPHVNSWKTLVHPEDLPMIMEKLEVHLEGQTPVYTCEYRLFTKSGMWRWNLAVGKVVSRDQDGKPLRMVGVDVDITEQKQRQILLETLQQTQSQFILANDPAETFNCLLENFLCLTGSTYGFIGEILFTTEGKPYLKTQAITNIAWNQETRELYDRFTPNLEFFNLNTLFGKVITTGQPVLSNDPMNDPRGGGLPKGHPPMHAFLGLPFYRGDRLVGMVGLANRANGYDAGLISYLQPLLSSCGIIIEAHQNSQQKIQAEKDLRTTEQMYRQILDSIPDMVLVKDRNFRILWANKAFRSYYNMTNDELKGILDSPINEPAFTKQYNEDDSYVFSTGKILDIPEEPVTRHDGHVTLFHTIKAPLLDESGEVVKSVGVSRDITERKQAELERAQRESLLRLIIETGPGCIKRVAADGTLLHMNPAGLKLIEAEEENEAVGLSVFDLVVPEHVDAFRQMHQNVLKGEEQTLQFEVQGFKGTQRWMETFAVPFRNPITKEVEQLAVTHDITERKKSEMALGGLAQSTVNLENPNFFENLVFQLASTLQVPMVLLSERVEETFPIAHGLVFWNKDHFESEFEYDCYDAPCENVFGGHQMYFPQGVQKLFPKEPTLKTLNIESYCGTPLFNSEGAIVGTLVIMDTKPLSLNAQDFSLLQIFAARVGAELERKGAEKALQKSEERYRILYEDNPSMYFTVTEDGKILSVNLFGAEQLGYSIRELVGQPVIGIFLEDDKPLVQQHFNSCLQNPMKVFNWELRKQKKDGSVLWVRETARALKSQNKQAVVLIVCEDITERKQTEERLRQSEAKEKEALLQSDELKSALLSSVSHELRTPLTAMKGSVSSIMENGSGSNGHKRQAVLKGIDREIDYMSQLVNNLLDMSQIEAGTLIPHKEWHLLEDLVEGALRHTDQILDTRDVDIHIPENVPPIFVDAVQIQQVLTNLLDNAVKYSSPASTIRLNIRIEAQNIAVEASNEGEPIQAQDLELLFDRFYRRPPIREKPIHGTGLGLAICKGLVEAHGGKIWAESIGRKVTITFTIPTTEQMANFSLEGRQKSKRE